MKAEFYRSTSEMLPTVSLAIAVSLAGLNAAARHTDLSGPGNSTLAGSYLHNYYVPAELAINYEEQIESLRHFAQKLLNESQETPQAVVDALNDHFWELV